MNLEFTKEDFVYSKLGAALVSAQRVENIAGNLLSFLENYSQDFGIMTDEFLNSSEKSKKARKKTLGQIFNFLKLNPTLILADELDEYARLRNILVHKSYKIFLDTKSDEQMWKTISFCYSFGRFSNRVEKFFEGFLYFLALRYVNNSQDLPEELKNKSESFDYFMESLNHKKLQGIERESIDTFDV
jgi:hypothetical protein